MWILLAVVVAGVVCAVADAVVPVRSPRRGGRLHAHPGGGSPETPLLQANPLPHPLRLSAHDGAGPERDPEDEDRRAGSWTAESPAGACEPRDDGSDSADTPADPCPDGGGSPDGGGGGSWD